MSKYDEGRKLRADIFVDTENRIKTDKTLSESVSNSIKNQKVILENDMVDTSNATKKELPCKVYVTKNRTMEAAREYVDGKHKVAVLNFASATTPGGGVVGGSSAQEECLCRVSTLYDAISKNDIFRKFYEPHRKDGDVIHNDDIIYTPDVTVFKDDDNKLFTDRTDWFNVDVITCAAPNLRDVPNNGWCNIGESNTPVKVDDNTLFEIHKKRAKRILDVAISNNVDVIILGAFGCGAFRNPPEVVAKAYKSILEDYKKYFSTIEFAVYVNSYSYPNFEAFKKIILG